MEEHKNTSELTDEEYNKILTEKIDEIKLKWDQEIDKKLVKDAAFDIDECKARFTATV